MRLAVIVPTVPGREDHLRRCLDAYRETAPHAKVYVEFGHDCAGKAWIAGAAKADADGYDYIHLTADDLEPQEGWLGVAVETVGKGYIPAPLVYHPDGQLESAGLMHLGCYRGPYDDWMVVDGTTVPFLTADMWGRIGMLPIHYATDQFVSWKGRQNGWDTVVRDGMRFTHHTALAGRNEGRSADDIREYLRVTGGVA